MKQKILLLSTIVALMIGMHGCSQPEKSQEVEEPKFSNKIDSIELEGLLTMLILDERAKVKWENGGRSIDTSFGGLKQAKKYGLLGAGYNFKNVCCIVIHRTGYYNEAKRQFAITIDYQVDNGGMRKKEKYGVEFLVKYDDYDKRYMVMK